MSAGAERVETLTGGAELARRARPPIGVLVILGALTAIGPFSIDMYLPGLPALATSLGASAASAQQTVAAYFLGIAFGQLLYGPLSDRFGRRGPLLAGTALYVAAALGCALAPSVAVLSGLRVLQAIGACAGLVIGRAVVRDRFPPQEVLHVFALMAVVVSLSPLIAPLVGGWLLLVTGWRELFLIQAGAGLLLGLAVYLRLVETRSEATAARARSESPLAAYAALLTEKRLTVFFLANACSAAALYVWIAGSADLVIRTYGFSAQHFGYVFGLNALGLMLGAQANARLARRVRPGVILRNATLFAFACALVLAVASFAGWGGMWGVLGPVFLVVTSMGFTQTNAQAEAINVDPRRSGSTSALLGSIGSFAGAGAAGLAGLFRDGTSRPMALAIAISLLLGVLAVTLLKRSSGPESRTAA